MDLTDRPADAAAPHQLPPQERAGDELLARALRRARWTIFWERLWPALVSIATVIGLFLAVSWLGLWLWLPPAGRAVGLGVFFLLTAAAFAPVLMLRVPSRIEGLRRLDRNSGLPHRPATAIADEIAAPTEDSYSVALWRAHIERALRAANTLKAGTPMPRLALRDPFAVRALVAVLVVATFFADGGERMKRIAAAFDWQGAAIPDKPPTIALAKEPEGQARGALQLSYKLEDDYGVIGAQAMFKLLNSEGTNGHPARPLYNAPDFPLVLPMARALVEQRRILALDGDAQASVLTALDALTLAPERFNMESNVYLGLRAIFWQLARAKSDDQLRDVVARMWDMAVHLEDGSVSDAEQALRAAEEALRQALERGASDEEIKRLTDQLRAALDKFMQALAEQMRKNPQQLARPLDPNARQLRPQDLRNMIDRLEQMARSGARDAAR